MIRERFPCTPEKASHAKWFVTVAGLSQTEAAIRVKLNVGTVSKIVNGHRFPMIPPTPPDRDSD